VFLRKYDPKGNVLRTGQYGTAAGDTAGAVASYDNGVYIAGHTSGTISGEISAGSDDAFLASVADAAPPTVAITFPKPGMDFEIPIVTIHGTASDDILVAKVEVTLDNVTWIVASGTASWSTDLTLRAGENSITARATDTSGKVGNATVTVRMSPNVSPVVLLTLFVGGALTVLGIVAVLDTRRRRVPHPPAKPPR